VDGFSTGGLQNAPAVEKEDFTELAPVDTRGPHLSPSYTNRVPAAGARCYAIRASNTRFDLAAVRQATASESDDCSKSDDWYEHFVRRIC
jgi:hypothetical protein